MGLPPPNSQVLSSGAGPTAEPEPPLGPGRLELLPLCKDLSDERRELAVAVVHPVYNHRLGIGRFVPDLPRGTMSVVLVSSGAEALPRSQGLKPLGPARPGLNRPPVLGI